MHQATDRTNTTQFNARCQIRLNIWRQAGFKATRNTSIVRWAVRTAQGGCEGGSMEAHSQVLCWRWCIVTVVVLRAGLCPSWQWIVLDRLRSGAEGVAQEWPRTSLQRARSARSSAYFTCANVHIMRGAMMGSRSHLASRHIKYPHISLRA